MEVNNLLQKYSLTRNTATQYIDAITRKNQTQTAKELDVSRDTINRYKNAFAQMKPRERTLIITALLQEKYLQQASER